MKRIDASFLLLPLILIVVVTGAEADKFVPFKGATYTSDNGRFAFDVMAHPGRVSAKLTEKINRTRTRTLWEYPSFDFNTHWAQAIVADDGRHVVVTNEEYRGRLRSGNQNDQKTDVRNAVAIFGADGRALHRFNLSDLIPEDVIASLDHTVTMMSWLKDCYLSDDGGRLVLMIRTGAAFDEDRKDDHQIALIELATGKIEHFGN